GEDLGGMCMLGTFSERAVISEHSAIKVDPDLPLDKVVLIGCGVPTGFGSAVHAAATEAGDTIAIYGIGGIGINAVQGAALAGARNVVAIDLLALFEKRIQGSLFGSGDPFHDIPRMVELYRSGDLKLDELITTTYTLDQVNQGYQDLLDGKNVRGVILYGG